MKKLFKYLGISLASLLLITAIGLYIFYSMYKNWEGFVNASERNDISQMQEILIRHSCRSLLCLWPFHIRISIMKP